MESVSNFMAEKGKVRGVAPLFLEFAVHAPGDDDAECAESDDEYRTDDLSIGETIGEVRRVSFPLSGHFNHFLPPTFTLRSSRYVFPRPEIS